MGYLGFWVTCKVVRPTAKKVGAIVDMAPPRNRNEVHIFIGMINYYRDMWSRRSHTLQSLNKLTSSSIKFRWTCVEQEVFDEIK